MIMRGTKQGRIIVPDTVFREPERDGWVLAVSPDCGSILAAFGEEFAVPEALLGLNVCVPHSGGTIIKAKDDDDDYRGRFILWCERDLLTVIGKVTPK